jgi:hypothetical protein
MGSGSSAGVIASERRRRHMGSTVAAARSPTKGKARLSNAWRTELQCDLGEVLRAPNGLESRRRHELGEGCPTAVAGARAPVSWWVGRINKRAHKLTWC